MSNGMRLPGSDEEYEQALAEVAEVSAERDPEEPLSTDQDTPSTAPPEAAPTALAPAPVIRPDALAALRRRQAAMRARLAKAPAQSGVPADAARADGLPAAARTVNPIKQLQDALDYCADKGGGDAAVARTLWDWALKRTAKLETVGYAALGQRWSIVVHALGSAVAYTKDEWRPR